MFTKCEERAGQEGTSLGIQLDGLGELRLKGRHQMGATYLGIRSKEFLLGSWRATVAEGESRKEKDGWVNIQTPPSPNSTTVVRFYLFYVLELCIIFWFIKRIFLVLKKKR